MPLARTNSIQIAYEVYGESSHPAILLIHGLGMPLTGWPPFWIEALVKAGFYVIIMDNRDAGQSQRFNAFGVPKITDIVLSGLFRKKISSPYTLYNMANDCANLLEYLDISQAHILGVSMGGMIAQCLALKHPKKVKSLTLIMTMSGDRSLPQPSLKVQWALLFSQPKEKNPEVQFKKMKQFYRVIMSPAYPLSEEQLDQFISRLIERGMHPRGMLRQLGAILNAENRSKQLANIDIKTLVIHGESDPLILPSSGKQLAACIPNASLKLFKGMGHDFPPDIEKEILTTIILHLTKDT